MDGNHLIDSLGIQGHEALPISTQYLQNRENVGGEDCLPTSPSPSQGQPASHVLRLCVGLLYTRRNGISPALNRVIVQLKGIETAHAVPSCHSRAWPTVQPDNLMAIRLPCFLSLEQRVPRGHRTFSRNVKFRIVRHVISVEGERRVTSTDGMSFEEFGHVYKR